MKPLLEYMFAKVHIETTDGRTIEGRVRSYVNGLDFAEEDVDCIAIEGFTQMIGQDEIKSITVLEPPDRSLM